jgi:hypothetical protein
MRVEKKRLSITSHLKWENRAAVDPGMAGAVGADADTVVVIVAVILPVAGEDLVRRTQMRRRSTMKTKTAHRRPSLHLNPNPPLRPHLKRHRPHPRLRRRSPQLTLFSPLVENVASWSDPQS